MIDKYLLDGIRTDLALHNTVLQQRTAADAKDSEKLFADKAAVDSESRKFWEDMQAKIEFIQASLDDPLKCAKAKDSRRVKLLVSEKSLKRQL